MSLFDLAYRALSFASDCLSSDGECFDYTKFE